MLISLDDVKSLVGIELHPLSVQGEIIKLVDIDLNKSILSIEAKSRSKISSRSTKLLEDVFEKLATNNYCCVSDLPNKNLTAMKQIETIVANLAFTQYFIYNNKNYLVYTPHKTKVPGTIEQLSLPDQQIAKRAINNLSKVDYSSLTALIEKEINRLNEELEHIHILSPGILSNTKMNEVVKEFQNIQQLISSTKFIPKENKHDNTLNYRNTFDLNNLDMTELIDLPEITGIDSGEDSYNLNNDDVENKELTDAASALKVPNIRRQTPSLSLLYERLLYGEIEIQPEYQRKDRIWSDDKKSKLIESILMQLPLPIFYFGEREDDVWVVIDGLQRLTTVQDFMKNKFPLKLDKDSSVYEMEGLFFKDFSRLYTRILREFEITAYVIELKENENSNKFIIELFHRINTYGVKLSDQEIRSAINFGSSVFFLRYLATSNLFLSATTNTINDKRQKDLELCLGALSFIVYGFEKFNHNRYDSFLSSTMRWINKQNFKKIDKNGEINYQSDSKIITDLTFKFEKGLKYSREIFGNDAFKKVQNASNRDPISKPLFESLVSIFANVTDEDFLQIKNNKDIFINTLYKAITSDSELYAKWTSESYINAERGLGYALSSSTGKRVTILYRFEAILNIIYNTTGRRITIKPLVEMKEND